MPSSEIISGFVQRFQLSYSPGRLKMILQNTLAICFVSSPFRNFYFIEISKRIEVFFWIPIQLGYDFRLYLMESERAFLSQILRQVIKSSNRKPYKLTAITNRANILFWTLYQNNLNLKTMGFN